MDVISAEMKTPCGRCGTTFYSEYQPPAWIFDGNKYHHNCLREDAIVRARKLLVAAGTLLKEEEPERAGTLIALSKGWSQLAIALAEDTD